MFTNHVTIKKYGNLLGRLPNPLKAHSVKALSTLSNTLEYLSVSINPQINNGTMINNIFCQDKPILKLMCALSLLTFSFLTFTFFIFSFLTFCFFSFFTLTFFILTFFSFGSGFLFSLTTTEVVFVFPLNTSNKQSRSRTILSNELSLLFSKSL